MTPAAERFAAGLVVAAIAIGAVVLVLDGGGGTTVRAEFSSARGLLEGNEVRVQGAPAGSVERIELTERNTALVTLTLEEGVPSVRRDAVAAVRPVDLLGDVYLSLSPGTDAERLRGAIPASRTTNAARLTDLLSAFPPAARRGLQALVVELGLGLERRGEDVNRAVVALRPALAATDGLMEELGSQRASLRSLVSDAEALTRQLDQRRTALGRTVDGLAGTLRAVADRAPALDDGLATVPDTLVRVRRTSRRLTRTARAARPLARALGDAAPALSRTSDELGPFLAQARPALADARPLIRQLDGLLDASEPTLGRLATGLRGLEASAPALDGLMAALVPAAAPISEGFFVNFADQAAEPGTQPFDPFADPRRRYWRGAAVFTCEAFGVKIAPNCLDQYLRRGPAPARGRERADRRPAPRSQAPPERREDQGRPENARPKLPTPPRVPDLPDTTLPEPLQRTLEGLTGGRPPGGGTSGAAPRPSGDDRLLDFLLAP